MTAFSVVVVGVVMVVTVEVVGSISGGMTVFRSLKYSKSGQKK